MSWPHKIAALAWSVLGLAPALLLTFARPTPGRSVGSSAHLLDHAGQAYLSYCPRGIATYTLSLLLLGPALVMLLGLGAPAPRSVKQLLATTARLLAVWSVAHALALALLLVCVIIAGQPARELLGWGVRLWVGLEVSILPALGVTAVCAVVLRKRGARSLLLGVAVAGLIGLLGQVERDSMTVFTPGAVDRSLFSGNPQRWPAGIGAAVAWLSVGLLLSVGVLALRSTSRVAQVQN